MTVRPARTDSFNGETHLVHMEKRALAFPKHGAASGAVVKEMW